jgi:hypothetical protein
MPEYFDLSLITPKTGTSKAEMEACMKQLGLPEGKNIVARFGNREIDVTY